jgi:hypothetical protein
MAKYGFDLDGTLDSCPEIAHLARALGLKGHSIYIITASDFSRKAIKAKLFGLNVVNYRKVIKVSGSSSELIGKAKGEECEKNGIDLFFDNDPGVIAGMAATSKTERVYVLDADAMQPKITPEPKREGCPCLEERYFIPSRCYHCPEFLDTPSVRSNHAHLHHTWEA